MLDSSRRCSYTSLPPASTSLIPARSAAEWLTARRRVSNPRQGAQAARVTSSACATSRRATCCATRSCARRGEASRRRRWSWTAASSPSVHRVALWNRVRASVALRVKLGDMSTGARGVLSGLAAFPLDGALICGQKTLSITWSFQSYGARDPPRGTRLCGGAPVVLSQPTCCDHQSRIPLPSPKCARRSGKLSRPLGETCPRESLRSSARTC